MERLADPDEADQEIIRAKREEYYVKELASQARQQDGAWGILADAMTCVRFRAAYGKISRGLACLSLAGVSAEYENIFLDVSGLPVSGSSRERMDLTATLEVNGVVTHLSSLMSVRELAAWIKTSRGAEPDDGIPSDRTVRRPRKSRRELV